MNLITFLQQLAEMAEHCPGDTQVIINGEAVHTLTVTLQNPIAERGAKSGMIQRQVDPFRAKQLCLDTNGRRPREMPLARYDF